MKFEIRTVDLRCADLRSRLGNSMRNTIQNNGNAVHRLRILHRKDPSMLMGVCYKATRAIVYERMR